MPNSHDENTQKSEALRAAIQVGLDSGVSDDTVEDIWAETLARRTKAESELRLMLEEAEASGISPRMPQEIMAAEDQLLAMLDEAEASGISEQTVDEIWDEATARNAQKV